MSRIRGLIVFLIVLAAAASACSGGNPASPTSTETGQSTQPPGTPAAPSPSNPTEPPAPPDPPPPGSTAPTITTQPKSQTIASGEDATLTVKATGSESLKYQWYTGSTGQTSSPLGGATSDRFTTAKLTKTTRYWVRVSTSGGITDSDTATITVEAPEASAETAPTITSQPKDKTVSSGQSATLSVTATGTAPLTYKWYRGQTGDTSSPIAGASVSSYTTPSLTTTIRYWVRVSNGVGSVDSEDATVTVSVPDGNSGFEEDVFELVNDRRAAGAMCGSTSYGSTAALAMSSRLRSAAMGHSQDMAANNYFSHTSLDGRTFDQRIREAGYTGSGPLGENIAAGQSSPQSVVNGWMGSPGHCRNIMDPAFRAIGVGYAYETDSTYRHYWTLTFGGS
jgi:uncharacterized protein YkwD